MTPDIALVVGDLLADVQELTDTVVFLKAERDTYRELLSTALEQVALLQACVKSQWVKAPGGDTFRLYDQIQAELSAREVAS